jgi:hypothetical protein
MIQIRDATYLDIPACVELGRLMFYESRFGAVTTFSESKVTTVLQNSVRMPQMYFRVAVRDEHIIGGMVGALMPEWWSTDSLQAGDLALFIDPAFRRYAALTSVRLLKDFQRWAFAHGAMRVVAGTTARPSIDLSPVYLRAGYHDVGHLYEVTPDEEK